MSGVDKDGCVFEQEISKQIVSKVSVIGAGG